MADDNGSGSGGGNGSVYWEVNGKRHNPAPPVVINGGGPGQSSFGVTASAMSGVGTLKATGHPARGEVKIGVKGVEGHSDTNFADIGISNPPKPDDHPGKFRVRLRFRKQDLDKLDPEERKWIEGRAKPIQDLDPNSVFLVVHVPAIQRPQPDPGEDWSDQPFEIHWEW